MARKMIVGIGLVVGLAVAPATAAFGNVHGITPLRCVGTADDGALTAADHTDRFDRGQLIPVVVGEGENGGIGGGAGGFDTPACPA